MISANERRNMTKIPKYFGDISEEELKRIEDNTRDFDTKIAEFQHRPQDNTCDDSIRDRCKKGPVLKSYTITIIKV